MKQTVLTLFLLASAITSAMASKAFPGVLTMKQSDGTLIEVRMHGDESFHWYATADGVLLSRQGSDFFVATIGDEGQLLPTETLAHNPDKRGAEERRLAASQDRSLFLSRLQQRSSAQPKREPIGTATPSYFPHTGTPTAVVVLVEFADTKFTVSDPAKVFDQYLNAEQLDDFGHSEQANYGSVAQYFNDMSFGQFRPQFDVYGPVTLAETAAYYGNNSANSDDVNFGEFLSDAADAADDIIDFSASKYDSDSDGYVDLVYFVYAGYGESNGADASTIWPKSGTRSIGTYDGKQLCRYGVNNELNMYPDFVGFDGPQINGIGLFCHEFSHTLGLPDLYPTATSAQVDNQEMEYWDLMDGGEYVFYGYYPTAYTSWEREAMGWKPIEELTADSQLTMKPLDNGGSGYKFCNPANNAEYMVMDVVENSGWNTHVPGHGLLVYHVCWPSATVDLWQSPNNTAGKPSMAVVPADGILISSYNENYTSSQYRKSHKGDAFPGTSSQTTLSAQMELPNYVWYNGESSAVKCGLRYISEDTAKETVSFEFLIDYATGIETIENEDPKSEIYDLQGRKMPSDATPADGLYIVNGKATVFRK